MRIAALVLSTICLTAALPAAQNRGALGAPETFRANAQVIGALGVAAARIEVVIQRYTSEAERTAIEGALETAGHPAFLTALRSSPDLGHVEHGPAKFTIRYARETRIDTGRRIVLVTDKPVFYVGGGAPEAPSRSGFDVAVLVLEVDPIGFGSGVMAAAARLKLGPDGGVLIEDYAEQPIKLASVTRKLW